MCTSTGGMGREATVFFKRLADLLATHWGQPYSIYLTFCLSPPNTEDDFSIILIGPDHM